MKKMGGVGAMMDKMPSQISGAAAKINPEDGDKSLVQIEAIISSMTFQERKSHHLFEEAVYFDQHSLTTWLYTTGGDILPLVYRVHA